MPNYSPKINHTVSLFSIAFILICWSITGCKRSEPECYQPINVRAFLSYKHWFIDTVTVDSLIGGDTTTFTYTKPKINDTVFDFSWMKVINEDSAFQFASNGNYMGVIFNSNKDSIQYIFTPDTTKSLLDTITIFYTPKVHFISNSCGYTYFYNINHINTTNHYIDSFAITTAEVNNTASTRNISLIFKK